MSQRPERDKQLSNLLYEKSTRVQLEDGLDYLELVLASETLTIEAFKKEIVKISPEGQHALLDLRQLYLEQGQQQAIEEYIKTFLRRYHVGQEKPFQHSFTFFSKAQKQRVEEMPSDKLHSEGLTCYGNKQYDSAVKYFNLAIEKGHEQALIDLGRCYHYGHGVPKDNELAINYLEQAAITKDATALYHLGLAFYDGWQEGKPDYNKALEYFVEAAFLNNSEAICQLGVYAEEGIGLVPKNPQEAYKQYLRAEQCGSVEGCYNVGRCHEYGIGVDEDLTMAATYYNRAVSKDKNHEPAQLAVERIEQLLQRQNTPDYDNDSSGYVAR